MSVSKAPFLTLLPVFFSGFLWLLPLPSLADLSMKPRTCSNCSGFGNSSSLHHQRPGIGINGHKSFGNHQYKSHRAHTYNSFRHSGEHKSDHDKPHYGHQHPHFDGYPHHYRPPYRHHHNGISLGIVAPIIYSGTYYHGVSPRAYSPAPMTRTAPMPSQNLTGQHIDAWAALGNYQTNQALDSFAYQRQQNPQNAVPKVGYALATALTGETEKAARTMDLALVGDVTDLHYFQADANTQLVLDDVLVNYSNQPIMRAAILYLQQDYEAAEDAVSESLNHCNDCRGEQNLQHLIQRKQR
ncbi:MAG: hypothetical protein R3341_01935 [Methylophaga sp.]|nr:hypothetical protein [Methylophaga sp.]